MAPRSTKPLPIPAAPARPPEEAGGLLTIDLGALAANWTALRHRTTPADCAAVVKSDGYGCGLEQVATALANAGAETFFVADALADFSRAEHDMAIKWVAGRCGIPLTTEAARAGLA